MYIYISDLNIVSWDQIIIDRQRNGTWAWADLTRVWPVHCAISAASERQWQLFTEPRQARWKVLLEDGPRCAVSASARWFRCGDFAPVMKSPSPASDWDTLSYAATPQPWLVWGWCLGAGKVQCQWHYGGLVVSSSLDPPKRWSLGTDGNGTSLVEFDEFSHLFFPILSWLPGQPCLITKGYI